MDGALTSEVSGTRTDAPTECDARINAAARVIGIVHIIGLTETLDRVDPLSAASGPGTGISLCGIRAPHAVLTPGETVQASA